MFNPFRARLLNITDDTGYIRAICPVIFSYVYQMRLKWFARKLKSRLDDYVWRKAVPSDFKIPKWVEGMKCFIHGPTTSTAEIVFYRSEGKIVWIVSTTNEDGRSNSASSAYPESQWMEVSMLIGRLLYHRTPISYRLTTEDRIITGSV